MPQRPGHFRTFPPSHLPTLPKRDSLPSGWCIHQVTIERRTFSLRGPVEPAELLDEIHDEDEGKGQSPYWGAIWPSATALASLVLREDWPRPLKTAELGCGLGLVGIAAMAAGLAVTLTDSVAIAVDVAAENAARNGLQAAEARVLNWLQPTSHSFEFVLGSDLLYDSELHEPLLNTLDQILKPGCECWFGDPHRSTAGEFVAVARRREYRVKIDTPEATGSDFQRLRLTRAK